MAIPLADETRSYRGPGALEHKEITMTDFSITASDMLDVDTFTTEGKTVLDAAKQAWLNLPEHMHKVCKKIIVAHRGKTWRKNSKWSIHYIFQIKKLPEFAIMYHTGNMGVPRDHYVLEGFTTDQLTDILINGQSRCVDRAETFGLLADVQSKVQELAITLDEKSQCLLGFSRPQLEAQEIMGPNSDLVLVRPTNVIETPEQFEELCQRSGYNILEHTIVVTFDKVLKAKLSGVTDLAAIWHDKRYGHSMCVSLRNEAHPRYNVWTDGTGVFEQAIESQAWFIVTQVD